LNTIVVDLEKLNNFASYRFSAFIQILKVIVKFKFRVLKLGRERGGENRTGWNPT
jgi:hypothetical protein